MTLDLDPVMDPHGLRLKAAAGELQVYRQSTVSSAEICLRRGKYALDPDRAYSTGERRAQGTAYHAGLETFFGWLMAWEDGAIVPPTDDFFRDMLASAQQSLHREVEQHEKAVGPGTFPWETSFGETWARIVGMLEAWRAQQAWPDPARYKVTGVEQEWWAPFIDGWTIKGTIDLVLQDLQSGVTVFEDHKTSGKRWPQSKGGPRQSPQPGIYAWAWWRLTGEMPRWFSYGVMTVGGVFERRLWPITETDVQKTIEKATRLLGLLELPIDMLPGNTTSNLCSPKWCDNWNDCPFGASFS